MPMQDVVKALEKAVEQGVLTFFTLLGASEAPEDWHADPRHCAGLAPLPVTTRRDGPPPRTR